MAREAALEVTGESLRAQGFSGPDLGRELAQRRTAAIAAAWAGPLL